MFYSKKGYCGYLLEISKHTSLSCHIWLMDVAIDIFKLLYDYKYIYNIDEV